MINKNIKWMSALYAVIWLFALISTLSFTSMGGRVNPNPNLKTFVVLSPILIFGAIGIWLLIKFYRKLFLSKQPMTLKVLVLIPLTLVIIIVSIWLILFMAGITGLVSTSTVVQF